MWAPLPFASVEPGPQAILAVAAALAFAAAVLRSPASLRPVAPAALALAGVALLACLQALRWPAALVGAVSPEHLRLVRDAAAALGEEASLAGLSLAPDLSWRAALAWASLALCFGAAGIVGRRRERRRWLFAALIAAALFQVAFGARHWLPESPTIWGVEVPRAGGRLRGTFVNPNHLATYLEMALAAAFAAGWWAWRQVRRELVLERRLVMTITPAVVWLTLFATLAFTSSRSGLVAAAIGVVLQGLLAAGASRRWRLAPLGALGALVGIGAVAAVGLQQGLGRLLTVSTYEVAWGSRALAYRAAVGLWRRFPLTGTGLGTFQDAFPLVRPRGLEGTWSHLHSDWLELLLTTGLAGAAIVVFGLTKLAARLSRVLRHGERAEDRAAALAALGALAALAVHEVLDFGLTTPANAFTLAVICGAAAGARLRGSTRGAGPRRAEPGRRPQ